MEQLGRANKYTNKEILQKWASIEIELFEKIIRPALSEGKTVVLDTHFSFQKKISPERAFEKGYYPVNVSVSLAHSSLLINRLAVEKVFVLLICLISPIETIIARKFTDSTRTTHMSKKIVAIEIDNELKLWKKLSNKLRLHSVRHKRELVSNLGKPSEARNKILSLINN